MSFAIDKVELVSLFIEAVLYGLYVALFSCTIYVLIYKRSSRHVHYGMFLVTVLMFVLATTHLLINLLQLVEAFSRSQIHPGAALAIFQNLSSFKNLFRSGVILAEILLGDIVLIYRCYVAWGSSLRAILLPLIVLLATAVTCGGVVYNFSKSTPDANVFYMSRIQSFIISTQVLVFTNNLICTCLLTWRLWRMSRVVVSRTQRHSIRAVARIILESGLITALAWGVYIALNATRHIAAIIVLNALAPVTGGAFCLIVSRVALSTAALHKPACDAVHHRASGSDPDSSPHPASSPRSNRSLYPHAASIPHPAFPTPISIPPVMDGTGRAHRPVEINVVSRESVRVEDLDVDMVCKEGDEVMMKMTLGRL